MTCGHVYVCNRLFVDLFVDNLQWSFYAIENEIVIEIVTEIETVYGPPRDEVAFGI